jgi:excisionase family DNA binding protein
VGMPPKSGELLTSGQVAKLCGVSIRTVCTLIDKGIIAGARIPGSGDRRVRREDLVRFMRERGFGKPEDVLPVALWVGFPRLPCFDREAVAGKAIHLTAADVWEAACECTAHRPDLVALNVNGLSGGAAAEICRRCRAMVHNPTVLVILPEDGGDCGDWQQTGATACLSWPGVGVQEMVVAMLEQRRKR